MTPRAPALLAGFVAVMMAPAASGHSVDLYQWDRMQSTVAEMQETVQRLQNSIQSGSTLDRIQELENEIQRLTSENERLQNKLRTQEGQSKLKLEDLEYRIIELEGGDPSILFQQEETGTAPTIGDQGAAPAEEGAQLTAVQQATVRPLGSTSSGGAASPEQAEYQAGVNAVRQGNASEGKALLGSFVTKYPDSDLAGDAYYWLGESYFISGDYQAAASRFLDAATLYPNSDTAPNSMVRLGVALNRIGQVSVACSTLKEVQRRYPGASAAVAQAAEEAQRAGCG
ncbi:MAG: tol-pal system protein YbgF [Pseudomonadota bacterium]